MRVYKPWYTRSLPEGARVITRKGQKLAQWADASGKKQTAPLTEDGMRILVQARTYVAAYRGGTGKWVRKAPRPVTGV